MRVRLTFTKQGALRYIGHLDLHKLWERSLRRAGLVLEDPAGLGPAPGFQLAC